MRVFGIVGYPLTHSFSGKYFSEKFARENINNATFKMFEIESPATIPQILANEKLLEGFCITIPHKKNIIAYLEEMSPAVREMNACNCIKVCNGKWKGYNTDVVGFEKSFTPLLQPYHTRALILGTGGAASAVAYVLRYLGIDYTFVSRQKDIGQLTYDDLTEDIIDQYKIIINCTPLGTFPHIDTKPAIPYQFITPRHYLYDLVYNPDVTAFLQQGIQKGATIKNGYDMLILQAEENWKIWNG